MEDKADLLESRIYDVILAEDDKMLNLVMTMQLSSCKELRVRKTRDGHDALAMMKESPPDLLILDISMPGLNGFEIINSLRQDEKLSSTPCIIHTSFDLTEIERVDLKLGETRFLTKTASQDLLAVVLELLCISVD